MSHIWIQSDCTNSTKGNYSDSKTIARLLLIILLSETSFGNNQGKRKDKSRKNMEGTMTFIKHIPVTNKKLFLVGQMFNSV